MNIRIPAAHQEMLRQWFSKDTENAAAIEGAILKATPSTVAGLGKQLASALAIPDQEAAELAQVFISMVASFVDLPLERRTGFSEAVVKSVFDDTPPPAEAVVRLEKLLTARPLQDSAKALVLLHEQPQVFQDCRIITDLRPLFGDNDTELRAFTVTHQLRIGYDTPSESSDFYVALEADDLRRLRSAIDRALSKQTSLESFSRQAGAVVIAEDPS